MGMGGRGKRGGGICRRMEPSTIQEKVCFLVLLKHFLCSKVCTVLNILYIIFFLKRFVFSCVQQAATLEFAQMPCSCTKLYKFSHLRYSSIMYYEKLVVYQHNNELCYCVDMSKVLKYLQLFQKCMLWRETFKFRLQPFLLQELNSLLVFFRSSSGNSLEPREQPSPCTST